MWGPDRGAGRDADGWGKGRGGWPRAGGGGGLGAGRGGGRRCVTALGQSRELPAAAITVPPPSARLTHFRERRGAATGGARGDGAGKGIDVGPSLPRSMPGRGRRRRTPSSQSGLALRRRTEAAVWLPLIKGSGLEAPPPRVARRLRQVRLASPGSDWAMLAATLGSGLVPAFLAP